MGWLWWAEVALGFVLAVGLFLFGAWFGARRERRRLEAQQRGPGWTGTAVRAGESVSVNLGGSGTFEFGHLGTPSVGRGDPPAGWWTREPRTPSAVEQAIREVCRAHRLCSREAGHPGPCATYAPDVDGRRRWRVLHASEQPTREHRADPPESDG